MRHDINDGPADAANIDEAPRNVVNHTPPKPKSKLPRESWIEAGRWLHVVGPTGNTIHDLSKLNDEPMPMRGRR
jgi:hypothetical protein